MSSSMELLGYSVGHLTPQHQRDPFTKVVGVPVHHTYIRHHSYFIIIIICGSLQLSTIQLLSTPLRGRSPSEGGNDASAGKLLSMEQSKSAFNCWVVGAQVISDRDRIQARRLHRWRWFSCRVFYCSLKMKTLLVMMKVPYHCLTSKLVDLLKGETLRRILTPSTTKTG